MQLDADGFISSSKRVELRPYVPRSPKHFELMADEELKANVGSTMIVDCESYPNYFLVVFKNTKINKYVILQIHYEDTNYDNLKFSWIMHNYWTVGFNSIKFDLPVMWLAYYRQDTIQIHDAVEDIIYRDVRPGEICKRYEFTIPQTSHIDLIEVCPGKGSLKLYGARIHGKRLQDLPFDPSKNLEDWQIPVVIDYCINDCDETDGLCKFMADRLELRHSMTVEYRENLLSKSDAQIAEAVISREIYKASGRWPRKPEIEIGSTYKYYPPDYIVYQTEPLQKLLAALKEAKFTINGFNGIDPPKELEKVKVSVGKNIYTFGIGGLHSTEKQVGYKSSDTHCIIDRDVSSYYPRIILNLRLYPEHLGPVFLDVFDTITERRLKAKEAKRIAEDKGLKVTINGTGGKFNDEWSRLRSPNCFIHMTLTGQLSLLMFIERAELAGVQVISGNTDGIVMFVPRELKQTLDVIIDQWEKDTGFRTEETEYVSYYARDVNAYFAIKCDSSVKVKGPYSEIGSTTATILDNNPTGQICSDAVKLFLGASVPIEKTIKECTDITRFVFVRNVKGGAHKDGHYLGKVIRWYYSNRCNGTINYIINGNKVPNTDNAMPAMDLPDNFPADVDHAWYINRANEILEEIAFKPRPKQISFF